MASLRIIKLLAFVGVMSLMGCRGYCERNYPAAGTAGCGCAPAAQQPCCTPAGYTPVQATPCVTPQAAGWHP
jgi:hypothetical protein